MSDENELTLVPLDSVKSSLHREILSRRAMAQRLLGVSAALFLNGSHPVWGHLLSGSALARADVDPAQTPWRPLFLQAKQCESLVALSEAIIPGSKDARVSEFIDLLLSVDTTDQQQKFVASLSELEAEARAKFSNTFQNLSAADRGTFLTFVSTAAETSSSRKAFDDLKQWVVGAYYSSEPGMRELGWTPNRFFPTFPGCQHPEGHV